MRKVLLVDHQDTTMALLAATFGIMPGCQVLKARDGKEALATARREKPDVILMDAMIPGMNGHEVCRALKQDPATARARVFMLTTQPREIERFRTLQGGADDYIVKPFSPLALLRKVDRSLTVQTLNTNWPAMAGG